MVVCMWLADFPCCTRVVLERLNSHFLRAFPILHYLYQQVARLPGSALIFFWLPIQWKINSCVYKWTRIFIERPLLAVKSTMTSPFTINRFEYSNEWWVWWQFKWHSIGYVFSGVSTTNTRSHKFVISTIVEHALDNSENRYLDVVSINEIYHYHDRQWHRLTMRSNNPTHRTSRLPTSAISMETEDKLCESAAFHNTGCN